MEKATVNLTYFLFKTEFLEKLDNFQFKKEKNSNSNSLLK